MKALPFLHQVGVQSLTTLLALGSTTAALAEPYVPPAGLGAPARRESAGTRGCVFGNPANLVALMPENNVGWTTDAYPRFYWYLPINQASFVEFQLEQISETSEAPETPVVLYQTRFAVTGEAGIMSLALLETASMPPLVEGDRYRWQVSIFCSPASEEGELQVEGWIERQVLDAELMTAISEASESELVGLYARNGYWFNALDQLVELHMADPENPDWQDQWTEFLDSVDLENIAGQPFFIHADAIADAD
ncbi:MAG: DUF928 domain-containing protein [Leptolyngbya sp. SIO1D8]|nr:DUF928 domain-containing protein [Leptolyngbya sp. SIO1D8]